MGYFPIPPLELGIPGAGRTKAGTAAEGDAGRGPSKSRAYQLSEEWDLPWQVPLQRREVPVPVEVKVRVGVKTTFTAPLTWSAGR